MSSSRPAPVPHCCHLDPRRRRALPRPGPRGDEHPRARLVGISALASSRRIVVLLTPGVRHFFESRFPIPRRSCSSCSVRDRDRVPLADGRPFRPVCAPGQAEPPGYDGEMAVSTSSPLDITALRADFPFLDELVGGKPLAYLDSASSTQKPRQVLDRMREFYEHEYANVHRGVYRLAERATEGYEGARRTVAAFVNAPSEREVIFTRSATESINLVAYAWGLQNLGPGDTVVVTELEHHANFVPWQFIASRDRRQLPAHPDRRHRRAAARRARRARPDARSRSSRPASSRTRSARSTRSSGCSLGARAGRDHGGRRGPGRTAPHVDVQALGCDFLALSSHKPVDRAASAHSGAAASCSRRWRRSTSEAR